MQFAIAQFFLNEDELNNLQTKYAEEQSTMLVPAGPYMNVISPDIDQTLESLKRYFHEELENYDKKVYEKQNFFKIIGKADQVHFEGVESPRLLDGNAFRKA
jgi:hypothetical protein